MSNPQSPLTQRGVSLQMVNNVQDWLRLDPSSPSGLIWRQHVSRKCRAGTPALTSSTGGYFKGRLHGVELYAHRVIWYLMHGTWPTVVDHKDGNGRNNKPENLADGTTAHNAHNRIHRGTATTKSGKWRARITVDRCTIHLGSFDTEEAAHTAYLAAKQRLHPTAPERCYAT